MVSKQLAAVLLLAGVAGVVLVSQADFGDIIRRIVVHIGEEQKKSTTRAPDVPVDFDKLWPKDASPLKFLNEPYRAVLDDCTPSRGGRNYFTNTVKNLNITAVHEKSGNSDWITLRLKPNDYGLHSSTCMFTSSCVQIDVGPQGVTNVPEGTNQLTLTMEARDRHNNKNASATVEIQLQCKSNI